jgi:hypothetical protein
MSGPLLTLGKPDELDRQLALFDSLGRAGRVELLRAVHAGTIAIVEAERLDMPPRRVLDNTRRPALVVLGGDDYASTGPSGWVTTPRLLRWARGALVHGSAADAASYRAAIPGTMACHRFVLVETSASCAAAWGQTFDVCGIRTLVLVPPAGVHPVPVAREPIQ